MLAFVRGLLVSWETGEKNAVVLDVHGFGIRVQVLGRLFKTLPPVGTEMLLYTYMVFRDPEWVVYGFGSAAERDFFAELLKVNGVGAAAGMALLNTLSLAELIQAILSNNTRLLTLAPGVGTKTAQRLALELKSKLATWHESSVISGSAGPPLSVREDVEMALMALGYRADEIQRGFGQVQVPQDSVDAWLRAMIQHLS